MYENYQPFRSWLRKIKNRETITSMAKGQAKKKRDGNTFMVIGANGYVGWGVVCQLAYKFQGCTIICVDKYIGSRDSITKHYPLEVRMNQLREYFDFTDEIVESNMKDYEECQTVMAIYNPDYTINLADGNSKHNTILQNILKANIDIKSNLIISTGYNNRGSFSNLNFKLTEFKTANVFGTCNWITLIDPLLSTVNDKTKLFNNMIFNLVNDGKVSFKDGYVPVLSLEDFSRAIVKIIRRGQKNNYEFYHACDKALPKSKIAFILQDTFRNFKINTSVKVQGNPDIIPNIKNKKRFVKLIDKHRPPVEYMISYSAKNYLDTR